MVFRDTKWQFWKTKVKTFLAKWALRDLGTSVHLLLYVEYLPNNTTQCKIKLNLTEEIL